MSNSEAPAFPSQRYIPTGHSFLDLCKHVPIGEGLSKRELFAAMAMQGLLSWAPDAYDGKYALAAITAVAHADALLHALSLSPEQVKEVK